MRSPLSSRISTTFRSRRPGEPLTQTGVPSRAGVKLTMRGEVDGLAVRQPLFEGLPTVYQFPQEMGFALDSDFTRRFLSTFDAELAPVLSVLDNLEAYFDVWLTPEDFLAWLASWMGVQLIETWRMGRQRQQVAHAVAMHPLRGTVRGLRLNVALYAGVSPERVEIVDSGGVAWSPSLDGTVPGSSPPSVTVRILTEDASGIDMTRVEGIVAAAKPAHVRHTVEVATE
jgi:phage tail-like protein